ncbi:transport-associated protein [Caballeronia peredens]|nr:transport-associated protein [Caballeronia peredens]
MKSIKPLSAGRAVLIVLASAGASFHAGETVAAASASAAASSASASVATHKQDRALRKLVYAEFAKDKTIDAGDIGVGVNSGVVTLTGTVSDAEHIEKAAAMAKGVPGVVSVTNKLSIKRNFAQ